MTEPADTHSPSQMWKQLSPDRRQAAAEAFWRDENAAAEQAQAIAVIAQRIKFRPKSVVALPIEKKARHLLATPAMSDLLAARLLVSYHLIHQRPMMARFLDALGIRHEDGLIADDDVGPPPADRLDAAVRQLSEEFPADDVALYLGTLRWQDPDTWGGLADLVPAPAGGGTPPEPA